MEFFENTTIHGLSYISSSKSWFSRAVWIFIVVLSFSAAGYLINKSYADWQKSPIATTVSTHPISQLAFPKVTVCPPKGSNTALNYDLMKAGNITLTKEDREQLTNITQTSLVHEDHLGFVKLSAEINNRQDLRKTYEGGLPIFRPSQDGRKLNLKIPDAPPSGRISTPWFGEEMRPDFYRVDHDYRYQINFPENIKDIVGTGKLVIQLDVDTRIADGWVEHVDFLGLGPRDNTGQGK